MFRSVRIHFKDLFDIFEGRIIFEEILRKLLIIDIKIHYIFQERVSSRRTTNDNFFKYIISNFIFNGNFYFGILRRMRVDDENMNIHNTRGYDSEIHTALCVHTVVLISK